MNCKNNCLLQLNEMIKQAIKNNDVNLIKNILQSNSYTKLSQEEKEEEVFKNLRLNFNIFSESKNLLNYLIFDYEISEEYNNKYQTKITSIDHMFYLRKLNNEFMK